MSKKFGIIIISIGVVLILSALLLFVRNCREDKNAGQASEDLLVDVKSQISNTINMDTATNDLDASINNDDSELAAITDMPSVNVSGYDFIGYISIPKLNIELPVMSEWDYNKLNIAPCRQAGSVKTDDLVIAAHNYTTHFAALDKIAVSDDVVFTNMNGDSIKYKVTEVKIVDGESVEEVINSGHDLVLYTCTYEGTTRVVVFCDRVE